MPASIQLVMASSSSTRGAKPPDSDSGRESKRIRKEIETGNKLGLKRSSALSRDLEQDLAPDQGAPSHWLLDHKLFKGTIMTAVMLSVAQLGLEVDNPQWQPVWDVCEHGFTVLFTAEAITKVFFLRCAYFGDRWNVLDCCLCLLSVVDMWVIRTIFGPVGVDLQMMSVLRSLRLFRLIRVLKLAKRWRKLVLVVTSIFSAMQSAAWVGLVLFGMIYIAGIAATTHFGGDPGKEYPGYTTVTDEIDSTDLLMEFNPHVFFGDLGSSMFTLFNLAIMVEWGEVIRPVLIKEPMFVIFFMAFSLFVICGVVNVIIGIFLTAVMCNAREFEAIDREKDVIAKVRALKDLADVWDGLCEERKGEVTLEKIKQAEMREPRLGQILEMVQLPRGYDTTDFFQLLDADGNDSLGYDDFVGNFYRLMDGGPFQHMCMLQKAVRNLRADVRKASAVSDAISADLSVRLGRIEALLSKGFSSGARMKASTPATFGFTACGCSLCSMKHGSADSVGGPDVSAIETEPVRETLAQSTAMSPCEVQLARSVADALERMARSIRSMTPESTSLGQLFRDDPVVELAYKRPVCSAARMGDHEPCDHAQPSTTLAGHDSLQDGCGAPHVASPGAASPKGCPLDVSKHNKGSLEANCDDEDALKLQRNRQPERVGGRWRVRGAVIQRGMQVVG